MITGFNHSGFIVKDMDRMLGFYRDMLGLEVVVDVESTPEQGDHTGLPNARRRIVRVGSPGSRHLLELTYFREPPSAEGHVGQHHLGSAHVAMDVADLTELHERLSGEGVPFVTGPVFRTNPDGSRVGICFAQDPEGNWLEFVEESGP